VSVEGRQSTERRSQTEGLGRRSKEVPSEGTTGETKRAARRCRARSSQHRWTEACVLWLCAGCRDALARSFARCRCTSAESTLGAVRECSMHSIERQSALANGLADR
jgi:hypothetical protein